MSVNKVYWDLNRIVIERDSICLWNIIGAVDYIMTFKLQKKPYSYYYKSPLRSLASIATDWNLDLKKLTEENNPSNQVIVTTQTGHQTMLRLKCVVGSDRLNIFNPVTNEQMLYDWAGGVAKYNQVFLFTKNKLTLKIYNKDNAPIFDKVLLSNIIDEDCVIVIETDLKTNSAQSLIQSPCTLKMNATETNVTFSRPE